MDRTTRSEPLDIEDPAALAGYLEASGRVAGGEAEGLRISVLSGGVSNRTVKVSFPSGKAWVLKQALSKLRVPVDWFADPARAHREAMAIGTLTRMCHQGCVPRLVFEDEGNHLIAMEAVGEPHDNWKSLLLQGRLEEDHVRQFAGLLAAIHAGGYLDRKSLASRFADRSYFRALRLEPYYSYTAGKVPEAAGFLSRLIRQTEMTAITLVHGDYSPKNILVHNGKLVLLDHEVIHFGDPAFDLGFSITHLVSKAHHLRRLRERFAEGACLYWQVYKAGIAGMPWADQLEERAARHTLGCLLARAAGRSQLEYLDQAERQRQAHAAAALAKAPPAGLEDLVGRFLDLVARQEQGGQGVSH